MHKFNLFEQVNGRAGRNLFEQVDGKAGRKETCCNLEGSKGLIRLEGGHVSVSRLDGEVCLRS